MTRKEKIIIEAQKFSDAQRMYGFIEGAIFADKTMIEKAVKWLEENITNDPTRGLMKKYGRCATRGELLRDFKQAMME